MPLPKTFANQPSPTDADGDGIPNDWEIQFSHNPNNAADAASDFDNDGLTALQEYQLFMTTNGQAGNPLGKWALQEIPMVWPPIYRSDYEYFDQYSYVTAANDKGDVVMQYSTSGLRLDGNWTQSEQALRLSEDGSVQKIEIPRRTSGYIYATDINEKGDVLLHWYSEDWTTIESYLQKADNSVTQITLNGNNCVAYRMNNFGDWIGWEITGNQGWRPVQVVDGMNILPHDNFTPWSILDINDYGQIIGTYYDYNSNENVIFTQLGSMFFSTGRQGDFPKFDEAQYSWKWPAALNQWGEFTGGGSGYDAQGNWRNSTFFYDGVYNDIVGEADLHDSYPTDLSDTGMVIFQSTSPVYGNQPYLWRDSVSAKCNLLLPSDDSSMLEGYLEPTKLSPNGKIFLTRYDVNWQPSAIIILTPDQDSDGDGMPDDWEKFYGFDPNTHDANLDSDSDGTNNLGEFLLRSDPHAAPIIDPNGEPIDTRPGVDTDGDGIPNNWEVVNGMNYADPSDAPLDFDRDGYTNLQEFRLNTDPRGAPSYSIRKVGPFTGVAYVDTASSFLGEGEAGMDRVFYSAYPSSGGSRPSVWSQTRTAENGHFSLYPGNTNGNFTTVASALNGAVLTKSSATHYTYWATSTAAPITLSGSIVASESISLSSASFSPSGNFLFAIRYSSTTGKYEPIVWKMPTTSGATYKPVVITPPVGSTISTWLNAYVNDYGIVVANGFVANQQRALVWTLNSAATSVQGAILPNLVTNGFTNTIGLSNHSTPIIGGTALISGNQQRATIWKYNSPTSITVTNLGTLPNGNFSNIVQISPNGILAGTSTILSGNSLKRQMFTASATSSTNSSSIDPSQHRLTPLGEASDSMPSITLLTSAGEILTTHYNSSSEPLYSLHRHGKTHTLDSLLPQSTGYALDSIKSINSQGTLLVTAWKDNALVTLLLTPDRDTDGDGLPDAFENAYQFNPFFKNSPNADTDNDGLSDPLEYENGTHPRNPDTDGDGMKDGWEIEWGLLPLDPSDALLDPDEDRVSNLRESQIGTIPTGIYKVDVVLTDTASHNPQILAAGDDGGIIYTGANTGDYSSNAQESILESTQEIFALTPPISNGSHQLPSITSTSRNDVSWTYYSFWGMYSNYFHDVASAKIHGQIRRYYDSWNPSQIISQEEYFLIPDILNFPDEIDWISLETVEQNLRNPDLHYGYQPLNDDENLYHYEHCISPSGIRRLHSSDWGNYLILNEYGEFVSYIPNDHSWQKINDQGLAASYETVYESTAGYNDAYYPKLFFSDGHSFTLPHDDIAASWLDWELLSLSNDGKALLRYGYYNEYFTSINRYFLYDKNTDTIQAIRLPASSQSSVTSLSNENGRMIIQGNKPCQITPDGTCIRLDALRIHNGTNMVRLGDLYPHSVTPNHISSNGRITVTTTNHQGQTVVIQITKHNDANNDGLPDDWSSAHNVTNPNADDDGDGLTNKQEYEMHTDPKKADTDNDSIPDSLDGDPNIPAAPDTDTDGDDVPDVDDAVPNDAEINWSKTPEAKYVWIEQVTHDNGLGYPIAINKKGRILFNKGITHDENQFNRVVWDSNLEEWISLPLMGILPTTIPYGFNGTEYLYSVTEPELYVEELYDINDDGAIYGTNFGLSMWTEEVGMAAGMVWKVSGSSAYASPTCFVRQTPLATPNTPNDYHGHNSRVTKGFIANDGTISTVSLESSRYEWGFHLSNATPASNAMQMIANFGDNNGYAGSVLDINRALCYEVAHDYSFTKLWLKEKSGLSVISFIADGFGIAEMSELPDYEQGKPNRLWITNGKNSYIEKRNGGSDSARWHKPASMEGEEFIRVSKHGVGITAGGELSPPKLWRNGKFTSLNDHKLTSKAEGVTITNAIDISSNGLILVQAMEGGITQTGILFPVDLAVDADRDGEITFDGKDKATAEKAYRFWINNDNDHQSNSNEDHPWTDSPDHESAAIESRRDLEDFVRLHFMIEGLQESFADGSMRLGVKWKKNTEGSPSIRLFKATDEEGGLSYLKEEAAADTQKAESAIGTVSGYGTLTLPQAITSELSSKNPTLYFIYEGLTEGKGELAFVIIKDGEELGEVGGLHLHLTDVRRMFERVKATPEQIDDPGLYRGSSSPPALNMGWEDDPWDYPFEEAWDEDAENKKYVVFVHGWRMTYRGSRSFGITMFKRLWWENFKGRYSAYRWPTYASEQDRLGFIELEGQSKEALQAYVSKYNHSEYRAWKSGISLKKYMESLPSDYSKNLVAHSMGNIVGGSALREGLSVKNYALLQAAVPATCYDGRNVLYQNPSQLILPVGGLNIPFLLWDFPMVGDDSVAAIRDMGYKEQIKNVSGNLVNFYLPDDEATSFAWEFNNSVDKPVAVPGSHPLHYLYFYEPNPPAGATSKLWVAPPARVMTDAHESMAMIDRSKTKAVGADGRTQGSIDSSINLDTEYGFGEEHSAEFERDIQRVGEFYKRLKNELEREE